MARKQLDLCILCNENPCSCKQILPNRIKPRKSDTSAKTPSSPLEGGSRASVMASMKSRSTDLAPTRPIQVIHNTPKVSNEEEELHRAIRALAPILHEDELVQYASILER